MEALSMRFKVEVGYLLTDEPTAKILYIKRCVAGELDPLCVGAVSARLAAELAFPLSNNRSLAEMMWQIYERKMQEGGSIDAQEGSPDEIEVTNWLDARS
jgi:hypothetical protein